jgi:signal recognition particle GTPase
MFCIFTARDCHIDIVLVDTAGRMQDNEPLMRALAKVYMNPLIDNKYKNKLREREKIKLKKTSKKEKKYVQN